MTEFADIKKRAWEICLQSNHPAPMSERTTMNESDPCALGISEFIPPTAAGFRNKGAQKVRRYRINISV